MNNSWISIFVALFISFFALEVSQTNCVNTANQPFDSCIFFIYSPYNCFSQITYFKGGSGSIKSFVKKTNDFEKDSIIESDTFIIRMTTDLAKVNKIIKQIMVEDTVHTNRMFDTYGFKLIVDKKKYIDVYGQNENIDRLLRVFSKYIKDSNERCGYFRLFNKIR